MSPMPLPPPTAPDDGRIKVYCRVRPSQTPSPLLVTEDGGGQHTVEWNIPADASADVINNARTSHRFWFDRVLGAGCGQADVFDAVARDAVDAALAGYNATVFAYGQTGSGKTWTITGGPERFADRGVIPRALARLFAAFADAAAAPPATDTTTAAAAAAAPGDADSPPPPAPPPPPRHFTAAVSYLEVYNEAGYDLLDSAAAAARAGGGGAGSRASTASDGGGLLTPRSGSREEGRLDGNREPEGGLGRPSDGLRRVYVMEDEGGGQHLRGLSRHACAGEEDALNLLFLGDTQRAMAETALNPASTRSHCIFTVHVEARSNGSAAVTRSKLHLVDLAGSERTGKTRSAGLLLREANAINRSLHFLELVIVALQQQGAQGQQQPTRHVPYRNSLMTTVLRDSLGGNCRTSMVATISPELAHTDESIATCRFAQRVARVRNAAVVNTAVDPAVLIAQLQARVVALETELAGVGPVGGVGDALTAAQLAAIGDAAAAWVAARDSGPLVIGALTPPRVHAAFDALRAVARRRPARVGDGGALQQQGQGGSPPPAAGAPAAPVTTAPPPQAPTSRTVDDGVPLPWGGRRLPLSLLRDRPAAKAAFTAQHGNAAAVREDVARLRDVYTQARAVAGEVNAARADVLQARANIEQRRRERVVAEVLGQRSGVVTEGGAPGAPLAPREPPVGAQEAPLLAALEAHKARYVAAHDRLSEHKRAAGELQAVVEARQAAVSAEFDAWYTHAVVAAVWPAAPLAPGSAGLLPWAPSGTGAGSGLPLIQAPVWVSQPPPVVGLHGRPISATVPVAARPMPTLSAGPLAALVALAVTPLPASAPPAPQNNPLAVTQPAAWQAALPAGAAEGLRGGATRAGAVTAAALFGPAPPPSPLPPPPHSQAVGSGTWGDALLPLGAGGVWGGA